VSFTAPERETVIRLNDDDELATVYAAHRSAEALADGHGPPTPAVGTAGPTVLEAAVDYHRRTYARAPRRAVKRTPSEATAFCIRLSSDPRFHMLSPTYRYCLLYAALHYADGEGKFWYGVPRWSSGVGTSESTIRLAVKGAEKLGLLTREPYARPNGSQGSNTYRFDPSVVSGVAAAAQACRREGEDEPKGWSPPKTRNRTVLKVGPIGPTNVTRRKRSKRRPVLKNWPPLKRTVPITSPKTKRARESRRNNAHRTLAARPRPLRGRLETRRSGARNDERISRYFGRPAWSTARGARSRPTDPGVPRRSSVLDHERDRDWDQEAQERRVRGPTVGRRVWDHSSSTRTVAEGKALDRRERSDWTGP
jgi:hypothetical protein